MAWSLFANGFAFINININYYAGSPNANVMT